LPIIVDATKCTGCLICGFRCSLRFEKEFNLSRSRVKIRRLVKADNEYSISFTDECDDCGICARYCPYEALIWEKKKGEV
jgi:Fe-S-cluster-containing dehydrogenase component